MKSSDYIKMIQEEDPTGECHIRLEGGVPFCAERKPGYYDGAYSYIDEDGNYVISKEGGKVDIHCIDLEDFVWDNDDALKKIKFKGIKKEDQREYMEQAEKYARQSAASNRSITDQYLREVLEKMREGWVVVQPDHEPVGHYNVMWFMKDPSKFKEKHDKKKGWIGCRYEDENQDIMCQGECQAILKSGFFKPMPDPDNKLIRWEFTLEPQA